MKKMTILVAFLGLNFMAFANDTNPTVRIEKVADAKKFSLELTNSELGAATVTLYDVNGVTLLTEKAGDKYYGKVFNLANLPAGSYELVITTADRDIVQPIELTQDRVEMDANKRSVFFAPTILTNQNKMDISFYRGKASDVSVSIYSNNELVFEEDFDNVTKVERRYDLANLPKGKYNVLVSTEFKSYYKEVVIN